MLLAWHSRTPYQHEYVALRSFCYTRHIFRPLCPQEIARQTEYINRWLALDEATKSKVKQDALMALASPTGKIGTVAAQVVSAIASVELPNGQWMDVIGLLLGFVSDPSNISLRVATLQAIGFICESLQDVRLIFSLSCAPDLRCDTETGDSIDAFERDLDCCYSWCAQGRAISGSPVRCHPRVAELA